tara:strand:- start:1796 stop:2134 length:339 start_codon:yes stop_codon:yes gene_type:complete
MSIPSFKCVTFSNWSKPITLVKITSSIIDGEKQDIKSPITFRGVIQPLKAQELQAKPLEMRSYKWLQIHTTAEQSLSDGEQIIYNGITYKILGVYDYMLNGFYEYHCVEVLR